MKRSHRYITSLFLTTVYLLIIFSPLSSLALQSKLAGHNVPGECSGDCSIDRCSLERSSAHACCCWKKNHRGAVEEHRHSESESAASIPAQKAGVPETKSGCCEKSAAETGHDDSATPPPREKRTTTISSGTCGNGVLFVIANFGDSYHLPYFFSAAIPVPGQLIHTTATPGLQASRFIEPPEHPTQVSFPS